MPSVRRVALPALLASAALMLLPRCNDGQTGRDGGEPVADAGEVADAGSPATDSGTPAVDSGTPRPDAGVDPLSVLGDFCDRYEQAVCVREAYCAGRGADAGSCVGSDPGCHLFGRAELAPAIRDGLVIYDAAQAALCFATPVAAYCASNNLFMLPECRSIFRGAVTDGGACWPAHFLGASVQACADGVCVGGSFGTQACTPGHCVSKLPALAPCRDDAGTDLVPGCGEGLLCDRVSDTCTPVGTLGSPCVLAGERCDTEYLGLLCLPTLDGGLACDLPRAGGGLCDAPAGFPLSSACRSLVCEGGRCQDTTDAGALYCMSSATPCPSGQRCSYDQSPPACAPRLGSGATCSPGADVCADGLHCATDPDAGFFVSSCQAIPSLGEPCDGTCASGLVCAARADGGSACAAVLDAGAGCAGAGDVRCPVGTVCRADSTTCAAPGGLGDACGGDRDCDRGLYCADQTRTCAVWRHAGAACQRDGECLYGFQCTDGGVCRTVCTAP